MRVQFTNQSNSILSPADSCIHIFLLRNLAKTGIECSQITPWRPIRNDIRKNGYSRIGVTCLRSTKETKWPFSYYSPLKVFKRMVY